MKLVVATKNAHKIHELSEMLAIDRLTLVSLADVGFTGEIEENGATFAENALIKARAAAKFHRLCRIHQQRTGCRSCEERKR